MGVTSPSPTISLQSSSPSNPLIPLTIIDGPTQRLYLASALALFQAIKLYDFATGYSIYSGSGPGSAADGIGGGAALQEPTTLVQDLVTILLAPFPSKLFLKWLALDFFVFFILLRVLGIPRMEGPLGKGGTVVGGKGTLWNVAVTGGVISGIDWGLFGEWKFRFRPWTLITSFFNALVTYQISTSEHRVRISDLINRGEHILGKHTVHILPHATAHLNPSSHPYCLTLPYSQSSASSTWPSPPSSIHTAAPLHEFMIPILTNNSVPYQITYEIHRIDTDLNEKPKTASTTSVIKVPLQSKQAVQKKDDWDDFDYEDDVEESQRSSLWSFGKSRALQHQAPFSLGDGSPGALDPSKEFKMTATQSLFQFPVTVSHPSVIRLVRLVDRHKNDIRISARSKETFIVQCPGGSFPPAEGVRASETSVQVEHRCIGDSADEFPAELVLRGVPPLRLKWHSTFSPSHSLKPQQHRSDVILGSSPAPFPSDYTLDGLVPPQFSGSPLTISGEGRQRASIGMITGSSNTDPNANRYAFAAAHPIRVPLNVSYAMAGQLVLRLDEVVDGLGNRANFVDLREKEDWERYKDDVQFIDNKGSDVKLVKSQQENPIIHSEAIQIHPRPAMSFAGACMKSLQEPLKLLRGKEVSLDLRLDTKSDTSSGGLVFGMDYYPPGKEPLGTFPGYDPGMGEGEIKHMDLIAHGSRPIQVKDQGTYELKSVGSQWCGGDIESPYTCTVLEQPLPKVDLNFTTLTDECAGEIGFRASFIFSGRPPFRVNYHTVQFRSPTSASSISEKKDHRIFRHSREDVEFVPERDGTFEYRFEMLSDADYKNIALQDVSRRQVVHPLATARFRQRNERKKVWSCEGDEVSTDVELTGTGPWNLEYAISGEKPIVVKNVMDNRHPIKVKIPPRIAKGGGQFVVALVSIEDGRGCKRTLSGEDLTVEVIRSKPSAKFYSASSKRFVSVRAKEVANLPLRLTGEKPWKLQYSIDGEEKASTEVSLSTANGELTAQKPGVYRIRSIRDGHCPGVVIENEADYEVAWLPQPELGLSVMAGVLDKRNVYIRDPVCINTEDSVEVNFAGKAPFAGIYRHWMEASSTIVDTKEIPAIQESASLFLDTGRTGHHIYEFTGVSDSIYPEWSPDGLQLPPNGKKLRLEQTVFPYPTAVLKRTSKTVVCVNEPLASTPGSQMRLELSGTAPFHVVFELTEEGSHLSETFEKDINSREWPVVLPHRFKGPGRHSLSVTSVRDANGCESLAASDIRPLSLISIDVAETASIAPVLTQSEHCVGDRLEYILQGQPPWTVVYQFNRKRHTVSNIREPKFVRVAEAPGTFGIASVSHQGQCAADMSDVLGVKTIRPIPTVRVDQGVNFIEDIHEGDQSEIVFSFDGTPPFSFTYNRMAAWDRSRDRKVLESHTVTNIQENSYSIFTSQEGTWTVSFIQDYYCAYPPLSSTAEGSSNDKGTMIKS